MTLQRETASAPPLLGAERPVPEPHLCYKTDVRDGCASPLTPARAGAGVLVPAPRASASAHRRPRPRRVPPG